MHAMHPPSEPPRIAFLRTLLHPTYHPSSQFTPPRVRWPPSGPCLRDGDHQIHIRRRVPEAVHGGAEGVDVHRGAEVLREEAKGDGGVGRRRGLRIEEGKIRVGGG